MYRYRISILPKFWLNVICIHGSFVCLTWHVFVWYYLVCTVICIVPKEQRCLPIFINLHCILILPCILFICVFLHKYPHPIPTKTFILLFMRRSSMIHVIMLFLLVVLYYLVLCNNQFVDFIFFLFWINILAQSINFLNIN